MKQKRNDVHRSGAIIPANYEYVFSYNLATTQDGWPVPSFGINCLLDRRYNVVGEDGKESFVQGKHNDDGRCCVVGLLNVAHAKFASHGNAGKCTICGAAFVNGDVWKHTATDEYIHVGHICANKYAMMADRSAWELENGRAREAAARQIQKKRNEEQNAAFLAEHPGLELALKTEHPIVQDIAARFHQFHQLSEKQIALVFKLANEAANPQAAEVYVDAPQGRVEFEGTVISCKDHDSAYGTCAKMTVKVVTSQGVWIAWFTAPALILDQAREIAIKETNNPLNVFLVLKEKQVRITATLSRGRERHFAFGKRPVGALV